MKDSNKKELQVGDSVFMTQYGVIHFIGKIDRLTDKRAFCGVFSFKREYAGQWLNKIPSEKWGGSYFIPNNDDIERFNKQQLSLFVSRFDYSKLTYESMLKIKEIIKSDKK